MATAPDVPTRERLHQVLGLRPDVLFPPAPRSLGELEERLDDPWSLSRALLTAPLPALQVVEAVVALGGSATVRRLMALLGVEESAPRPVRDATDDVLRWLDDRALVVQHGDRVHAASGASAIFPAPLRLGPPLRQCLDDLPARELTSILRHLAVTLPASKARGALVPKITAVLTDAARVRTLVAEAPSGVAAEVSALAGAAPVDEPPGGHGHGGRNATQRRRSAMDWAVERGLIVRWADAWTTVMPAEVGLALRGEHYRAPFDPLPPDLPTHVVDADRVGSASSAAALTFLGEATAVLDLLARAPFAQLKAGGVGAREITRAARAVGSDEALVRLTLELAGAAGLLEEDGGRVGAAESMHGWRSSPPGTQLADLLLAWSRYGGTPTQSREEGKALPALSVAPSCEGCRAGRTALLTTLSGLAHDEAAGLTDLAARARWHAQAAHGITEGDDVPFAATWREAEKLGVIALGGLAPLGGTVLAGDATALTKATTTLLPSATTSASFGSDLTAVVAGTPAAEVSALLDECADREGRGGAVVWRLSSGSVRRALDDGGFGDGPPGGHALLERLAGIGEGELPQPLRYLVEDVARRHGSLAVRPAQTVVVGADEALVAQAAADRSLKTLDLHVVAPTVLASDGDPDVVLAALRKAGYLPVPQDPRGQRVPPARAAQEVREPAPGETSSGGPGATSDVMDGLDEEILAFLGDGTRFALGRGPVDVDALVERLLAADEGSGTTVDEAASTTEAAIAAGAKKLATTHARLLAHAIETGAAVEVVYLSSTSTATERTLSEIELVGGAISAWCHLREDQRWFSLDGLRAVRPPR